MKRIFDIVIALLGLIITSPLLVILALLVYRDLGSPIFYRQIRPGLDAKPFEMIKFRTMRPAIEVDEDGSPSSDDDRITTFGTLMRSMSLDELPELWSVLKGDMSLVGPRPLLMQYLPLYSEEQARRHLVLPGITGWAQVNGRNSLTWKDKLNMDTWYVDNHTLWMDIKILMLTIKCVLKREGISAEGHVTIENFNGRN